MKGLAALGDVSHFVGNQAADCVEVFCGQINLERLAHAAYFGVAIDAPRIVAEAVNITRIFVFVKLVLDFPDDFLQHVLNRDETG